MTEAEKAFDDGYGYVIKYTGRMYEDSRYILRQLNGVVTFANNIHSASFFPDEKDALMVLFITLDSWTKEDQAQFPESDFQVMSPKETMIALIMES
jgi:hypothetical protein